VRFIFLPLLNRDPVRPKVFGIGETLHPLLPEVSVRHRVTQHRHALAGSSKQADYGSAGLALPRSGAGSTDGHHRPTRLQHGPAWCEQAEIRPGRECPTREVHYLLVRQIGVGEDARIHAQSSDHFLQLILRMDRDAGWISRSRQLGRIVSIRDVGDLLGGECNHLGRVIRPEHGVEVVEITPGGAEDQNS
jgi:hypothetical protein